jgi:signal transduction histidine kinase
MAEDITRLMKTAQNSPPRQSDTSIDSSVQTYNRYLRKLKTVIREADRLGETLSDFLRYAGKLELHPAQCDVNELLDDLIDFYEPQAISEGIQIRRSLCNRPLICRVDADLLKQAFLNLFINATQAMDHSGELIIRSQGVGNVAKIDITDTGPGVSPEQQKKIFDAYYTTRPGGTGLGLPTCRRIIEEHTGHVELHSEVGKGSNFTIVLPLMKSSGSDSHE